MATDISPFKKHTGVAGIKDHVGRKRKRVRQSHADKRSGRKAAALRNA